MFGEADLARIERGEYTDREVRELAAEARDLRKLSRGLLEESEYWKGLVERTSENLYYEALRVVSRLRKKHA